MSERRSRRRLPDIDILDQSFEEWYESKAERYRNLAGIRRHLNDHHGKGNWGDDEFDQYMRQLYDEAREDAEVLQRSELRKALPAVKPDATVEERIQAYMDYFEDVSPNDLVMIQTMVNLEMAIESANQQWVDVLTGDSINRTAAKGWSDIIRGLSREHRQIQETLGIERAGRDERDKASDQVEYVRDVIRRSAAFVKEHAIQIRCHHCMAEDAEVEIDLGFILFHFRQDAPWEFRFQCPRCGEAVQIPPT